MRNNFWGRFCLSLWILFVSFDALGQASENPLAPVKLESPRETMQTFLEAMRDYKTGREKNDPRLLARIDAALECLDLREASPVLQAEMGREVAIYLKEIIDRIIVVEYDKIPLEIAKDGPPWRLRGTEIAIARIDSGDYSGRFQFSKQTVRSARKFYEKVRHLPYLPGSGGGALYSPPWLEDNIPTWARSTMVLFPNWKWLGLGIALIFGFFARWLGVFSARLLSRLNRRMNLRWYERILSLTEKPIGWAFVSALWFTAIQLLDFDGFFAILLQVLVKVIFSFACLAIVYRLVQVFVEFGEERMRLRGQAIDQHLFQLLKKTMQVLVIAFGALVVFQNLGVNVVSLLAGLGIGGLAVALAAKDTCANFFGSLTIVLDRTYKLGDLVRIGKYEGTVEEVGFRSTKIRTPEDTLVSLPNSLVASENIDNLGKRGVRRILLFLGIICETPPDKIERFLKEILALLEANPLVRRGDFTAHLFDLKSDNLELRVEFYLHVSSVLAERQEREKILFAILNLARNQAIEFAYPTRTLHMAAAEAK